MSPTYVRRVTGIDWGVEAGHNQNRQYTNHSEKIDSRKWASTYVYVIPVEHPCRVARHAEQRRHAAVHDTHLYVHMGWLRLVGSLKS